MAGTFFAKVEPGDGRGLSYREKEGREFTGSGIFLCFVQLLMQIRNNNLLPAYQRLIRINHRLHVNIQDLASQCIKRNVQ